MVAPCSFFSDSSTTEIYTFPTRRSSDLDPVLGEFRRERVHVLPDQAAVFLAERLGNDRDRKSTRLNSSHVEISYAVFCLKKKIDDSPDKMRHEHAVVDDRADPPGTEYPA